MSEPLDSATAIPTATPSPSTSETDYIDHASRLIPSNRVMQSVDKLFSGPVEADSRPDQLTGEPIEMENRDIANLMVEKGFDGRGIIPIANPPRRPDLAYRLFLKTLGDDPAHTGLKSALSAVDSAAAHRALSMLFDSRYKRTKIETILKRAGIGIPQMRDIWRQARLDEGFMQLLNAYPRAMKDVARDARSTREACRFCSGSGRVVDEHAPPVKASRGREPEPVMIECPSCRGRGWIRKSGDRDARALMGQVLGVTNKPSLITATTNVFNLESVIGDIEQLQQKATRGIYDVTAEPVDETTKADPAKT